MANLFPVIAVVVLAAIGALFVVRGYKAYLAKQQRPRELMRLAVKRRLRLNVEADATLDDRYRYFVAFLRGRARCTFNTLDGVIVVDDESWKIRLGDFRYNVPVRVAKGSGEVTECFSYALIETPFRGAPDLFIRREGFVDRLQGVLGFDDIDFESAEFSDRFHVTSSDKRFAYRVIGPRMMEFLLEGDPPTIEFRDGVCCLMRGEKWWSTGEFEQTIDWARAFFSRWPQRAQSPAND